MGSLIESFSQAVRKEREEREKGLIGLERERRRKRKEEEEGRERRIEEKDNVGVEIVGAVRRRSFRQSRKPKGGRRVWDSKV